jgi:DNA-binding NarL/FixJ family response regulator
VLPWTPSERKYTDALARLFDIGYQFPQEGSEYELLEQITKTALSALDASVVLLYPLKAGAHGYIAKDDHFHGLELVEAINEIHRGEAIFGPSVAHLMRQFFADGQLDQEISAERLTAREAEVLDLLAKNKTNDEIKEILVISESTVKTHVSSILAKLHLKSRHQVALYSVFRQHRKYAR